MSASIWRPFFQIIVWTAPIFAGWGEDGAHASERDCDYCPKTTLVQVSDFTAPLAVGVYEVTQGEFDRFIDDTGHSLGDSCGIWDDEARRVRSSDPRALVGSADHPVVCVSWEDAQAYVKWLSDKTGASWRLLTGEEWEYFARAGATTPFHTGQTISKSEAAYGEKYSRGSRVSTRPVGSFEPNDFGLYDVHGNVWEWTADCWVDNPASSAVKRNDRLGGGYRRDNEGADEDCPDKVLRGGSWRDDASAIGLAARSAAAAGDRTAYYGFRVVRSDVVGKVFDDCEEGKEYCPKMVVVPSGRFMMGSLPSEEGRDDDEGPRRRVEISAALAVGVHEVTRYEFGRFVYATGRSMGNSCWTWENGERKDRSGRGWRNPGFSQRDSHPVVCVSWNDARAYVRWLSGETGESYRLLSESEWEYVARARTQTRYHWGDSSSSQCRYANGADMSAKRHNSGWTVADCDDGYYRTSPVGSFAANSFGLHDVHGNVWEWVQDCWNGSYTGAPRNGSAWESGECSLRVLRGGSWVSIPRLLRAAYRYWIGSGGRYDNVGFRVARTFTP